MKKIVFAMILLVGICFTTASCTKEKSLKGTTWIATQSEDEFVVNYTLSFYESTFTLDTRVGGEFFTSSGTYTYNDPVVTLFVPGEGNLSGTVSGDVLILNGLAFTKR